MKRWLRALLSLILATVPLMSISTWKSATAAGPNLIANDSVESEQTAAPTKPVGFQNNKWGTNTSTMSYIKTGGYNSGRSVKVQTTAYTSGDAKWYFDPVAVQPNTKYDFSDYYISNVTTHLTAQLENTAGQLSYIYLGAVPPSAAWKQVTASYTTPANAKKVTVFHLLSAVGSLQTDEFYFGTSEGTTPTPTPPPSTPTVSLTAPANNATVSGTINVIANASDTNGIAGVQFKLDGANLGSEDTTGPYSVSWDTTAATNATHTLTAVARNTQGATATSTAVTVTVNNPITPPPGDPDNLIANASMETANAGNTAPVSWLSTTWGNNTTQFAYLNTGRTGNRSGQVTTSNHTSGDSRWQFADITVSPNTKYVYSNYYKSTAASEIDAAVTMQDGSIQYYYVGNAPVAADWTKLNGEITTPANAKSITIYHTLITNGTLTTDDYSLVKTTSTPSPTPPTVSISAPAAGATVSGNVTLSANASDAVAIASVQFKIDGVNVGAAVTNMPYSFVWDSRGVANGTHTVTAVARNTNNLETTSDPVTFTVNNPVTPPPPTPTNLVANPSVESANAGNTAPLNWSNSKWGTNTAAFSYLTTGRTGNRSVRTQVTAYTSGDAKWMHDNVLVTPGTTYQYSGYYQANVATELDVAVTMQDNTIQYYYLATAPASANWNQLTAQFTMPTSAKSAVFFQVLARVGTLTLDDVSVSAYTPAAFNHAMVSLTFDDGWRSIYENGLPLLQKYNLKSTQYLLTETVSYPDYMTIAMMQGFANARHEIASHTVSHPHLPLLSASELNTELTQSQAALRNWTSQPVSNFASPFGEYNATTVSAIRQLYGSHRSTDVGYNTKDTFDIYNIRVQNIYNTTTATEVQGWVNKAIADKSWLVLVYHEIDDTPGTAQYNTTPAQLESHLQIVKNSGVAVPTVQEALAEILAQL